ncbi:MAG: methionine biosynthesis protein MetW [Gammaproteobacteria bacterium]|nr:MAG: methionine biosynthesis protein MetW [Gammaproteobacteria bacterium]
MRADLEIISNWVKPGSHLLDLGCGDGTLLRHLMDTRQVTGYGLEINADNITACIEKGVNVIEQNLDTAGLSNFPDQSFDLVVMTQALQAVRRPDLLLDEMLRVGREAIVTFPNFGHWRLRTWLMIKGRMPESRTLPYKWYNTPNIHLCTFKDFEELCVQKNVYIRQRMVVDDAHRDRWFIQIWPNMLGQVAIYHVSR